MELKRITKIAIFLIVSLVIIVFVYIDSGVMILWAGILLILKGVSGISALSYLLKWIFNRELKEIDDRWHNLYEPTSKELKKFKETIVLNSDFNKRTQELYTLEKTLEDIEKKSNYNYDFKLQQLIKRVLGNPQNHSMNNFCVLEYDINEKLNELRNSRQRWDKW